MPKIGPISGSGPNKNAIGKFERRPGETSPNPFWKSLVIAPMHHGAMRLSLG
jgi:hypothetical protein